MAHIVLKFVGGKRFLVGYPADDLTNEAVHERAAERNMTDEEWVADALALQGYYQLYRLGKEDFADVEPLQPAEARAVTLEPKRRG